jgi:hypothetical protein
MKIPSAEPFSIISANVTSGYDGQRTTGGLITVPDATDYIVKKIHSQ